MCNFIPVDVMSAICDDQSFDQIKEAMVSASVDIEENVGEEYIPFFSPICYKEIEE